MKDIIVRGMAAEGMLRFFVAKTTTMVEKARKTHDLYPAASAALGRTMTIASMMGLMLKSGGAKLSITIKGNGPMGSIIVVTDSMGRVKGYVDNPSIELPLKGNGKLDVAAAVGTKGKLTVIKDLGLREPYIGQVDLTSGEIAEDFAYYFTVSEQQPSAVSLGVLVDTDYSIKSAGGILIQPMPDAPEEILASLENRLYKMNSVSDLISKGLVPEEILREALGDIDFIIYDHIEPEYKCDCSKERLEKVIISLGEDEIRDIIATQGGAELVCHFCNQKYYFPREELNYLLNNSK